MEIKVSLQEGQSGSCYFPLPEGEADQLLATFGKRVLCIINGQSKLHCAIQKNKHIGYFIMVGKGNQKRLKIEPGEQVELHFKTDTTDYQAPLPEELKEVFFTDPEGKALFDHLTDGKKRSLIHYVNNAKQSDTRINRALKIMEQLKMGKTSLKDFFK